MSKIIVLKDKVNCSRCRTFISKGGMTALAKLTTVIDADKNDKPNTVWSKWLKKCSPYIVAVKGKPKVINYPFVFITDDSQKKIITAFSAYDKGLLDPAKLTAYIKKVCPEYCDGCTDTSTPEPTLYKQCDKCKGLGVVAIALACLLTLFSAGCCATRIKTPEASGWRFAFLYPFETGSASIKTLNGSAEVGNYKTSGGAAELVPLVDASGKLVGTFIGTAAKAAVVP